MPYAYIDWTDIDTDELIEELERRSEDTKTIVQDEVKQIIEKIWMCKKLGVSADDYISELVYEVLGKIV